MIYAGVDVAKHKHQVAIIDDKGEIHEDNLVVVNNKSGFKKLHEILCRIQSHTDQECQIAMEDTGHYNLPILQFLKQMNYRVYRYNPILIKEFSKVHTLRKTKTDKTDAMVIAKKLMSDFEKREQLSDRTSAELKELTRYRRDLENIRLSLRLNIQEFWKKAFLNWPLTVKFATPSI